MSARPASSLSWYWLAGYLLLDAAQRLAACSLTEHHLQSRVLAELRHLPAARRQTLRGLVLTEQGVTAATNDQRHILTTAVRRVLTALQREHSQRAVLRRGGDAL